MDSLRSLLPDQQFERLLEDVPEVGQELSGDRPVDEAVVGGRVTDIMALISIFSSTPDDPGFHGHAEYGHDYFSGHDGLPRSFAALDKGRNSSR